MLDRQWAAQAESTTDPADFLGAFSRQLTTSAGRAAGLAAVALEGAHADQDIAAVAAQLKSQRQVMAAWLVDGLVMQARGEMPSGRAPAASCCSPSMMSSHLDDGSVALVHQLIQTRTCSALLCVRTPGRTPDLVTSHWKDAVAERIDLAPWDQAQTGEVLTGVLGGQVLPHGS